MFAKFLNNIQTYLFFWIIGAILFGLASVKIFGGYSFSPLICLLAALVMIYPSLVPLDFSKFRKSLKEYKIIIMSLLFNFLFLPFIAFFIGYIFLGDHPSLWLGLMLLSLLPGGGMATTWAQRSKADMASTVGIIFFNLAAAVLISPFALSYFLNKLSGKIALDYINQDSCLLEYANSATSCFLGSGSISPLKILIPVILIVVLPAIIAFLTQKIIKKHKGEEYFLSIKSKFGKFSNLGLILILFALMGINNNQILFSYPDMIILTILPLLIFYLLSIGGALLLYKYFFRSSQGKAFVWGTYLRYITLALGLGISMIYQNEALFLIIVPVVMSYLVQIPSSFLIAKYFNKINNN